MTLKKMQEDVDRWMSQYREGYWPPAEQIVCLAEEVGELAREINHNYGPKKKKDMEPEGHIPEEIADIMFILCCIANQLDINLDDAWQETVDKFDKRDKHRFERK